MNNNITLSEATLKELRVSAKGSNITFPKTALVTNARITEKRNDKKEAIPGSRAKIVLTAVDAETAQALEKLNINVSQLKGIVVEVEGTDEFLANIEVNELKGKKFSLENAELALLWITRGKNDGSYGGFKLVLSELNEISTVNKKE